MIGLSARRLICLISTYLLFCLLVCIVMSGCVSYKKYRKVLEENGEMMVNIQTMHDKLCKDLKCGEDLF